MKMSNEYIAFCFKSLRKEEVHTEVKRIGRLLKAEDMKEVWRKYTDRKQKKRRVESLNCCREVINNILFEIIVKNELDPEMLMESVMNMEKHERLEEVNRKRNQLWEEQDKMEIKQENKIKKQRRTRIVADSALRKRRRTGKLKYRVVSDPLFL